MSITVRGLSETIAGLEAVQQRIEDPSPALEVVASSLRDFVAERFRTRTAPDGTAWAPLKPATIRYRKSDGSLQASIFAHVVGRTIRLGADDPAAVFQNATRPFLPSDLSTGPAAEEGAQLVATVAAYVVSGETG